MTHRGRLAAALLVLVLPWGAPACGPRGDGRPGGPPPAISLTDAEGRAVSLPAPAERVISLVPSATQTLAALGAEDRVVARTDFDTLSWARPLPSVGGGVLPSLEAIVALRPDLVVRFAGSQDPRTPAALERLGIPQLAIRPDRIADAMGAIRLLGAATGLSAAADSLVRALEAGLDSVRAESAGGPRVRAAYVMGGNPSWVAGPGTYIQEIIEIAGGENAFADLPSLYAAVSVEEFLARQMDVILTPDATRLDPRIMGRARVAEVGDLLEFPGPSVAGSARALAHLFREEGGR